MEGNIITTNFDARHHWKEFRAVTMEGMEAIAGVGDHSRYLNVETTDSLQESEYMFNGLPNVPKRSSELKRLPAVEYSEGPPVYYVQEMYGYQYIYTQRAARYDRTGNIVDVVSSMGEGAADSIEWVCVAILNNATTAVGGWDNKTLAAADHTTLDDRTYSNVLTPGGATQMFLQTVWNYAKKGITNDNGRVIQVPIKAIEVAPERVPAFRNLLDASVLVGQDNPAIKNPYSELLRPEMIQGNVRLAGTFDVHIIFEGHRLNVFIAENPRTRTWNNDELEAIHHAIQFELVVGWTDARRYAFQGGE